MRRRKRNKQPETHSKERILRSAKGEFSERGFSGARMSAIAKRAAVNKALIHYYFKDKETLYLEVLTRIFRGGDESFPIPEYMGKWRLTPSQKLYVIIFFMVNIFLKATDPDAMRIIFWEVAEGKRYLDSLIMEYSMPRQKILHAVVKEGIESGEFETDFPDLAAANLSTFISFYSINKQFHAGKPLFKELYGDATDDDAFNFVLENVFKSLKPKGRKLDVPAIPEDLNNILDEVLRILIEKQDEGVNEEVFKRIEAVLRQ
ncbi:MAG: TetR/AcrR family transcriptional regulator [Spirochaetes bacterium]|nr:TetR/AcrR family transcriptional regulator [Spirochaetota bacterium]